MSLYAVPRAADTGRIYAPSLICDHCDEPVVSAADVYIAHPTDTSGPALVFFVHKWCLTDFCEEHGGRSRWQAVFMHDYFVRLALALGLRLEALPAQAAEEIV